MSSEQLVLAVLGWCTVFNMGVLVFSSLALVCCGGPIARLHHKWFGISEAELKREYFRYLANYKILTLILNLVPYLALRLALS